ncbi:hypothetical protein [Teredinibacter sp. KSP-S5-2]|uniref:hypothetical protein n=1 Tax=Teredinibacter sp. KSP-S5-2 TaxID=3034506 RepID=UPI002934A43D|nr:hypothetical protein [Teredinibacter sp. KSP-S5-2]WNO10454.1 hypothetical protein P5V12_04645 [Teredinibacter sp. KSP-S5-2]
MAIDYTIMKELELVVTKVSGVFTDEELVGHFSRLVEDPDFRPEFTRLTDLRHVLVFEITKEGVQEAARRVPFDSHSMSALLISDLTRREWATLWGVTAMSSNAFFFTTDILLEALVWLGLEAKENQIRSYLNSLN